MPHPYRPGAESYGRTHTLAERRRWAVVLFALCPSGSARTALQPLIQPLGVVRCAMCRRLVRFLASDLVTLLQPRRDALVPPPAFAGQAPPARNAARRSI